MSMRPFQPRGEKAQWRIIYDLLDRLDVGDILGYDQITEALEVDHINQVRGAVLRAARVWGQDRHRALTPVHKVGYRIVAGAETEILIRRQHRRTRRSAGRTRDLARDTDRSLLTPADRAKWDRMEIELSRQADMVARIDTRTAKVEQAIEVDRAARRATEEKVARMEEALRRHGIEAEQT
jgi:hypothetical protein